jgi:hypothetical protein
MIRTAPVDSRRAVNPDRIEKFLDKSNTWGIQSFGNKSQRPNTKSTRPQTLYDPTVSWDGQSTNPNVFSKFDIDPRVTGKYILAGSRLVETSSELPAGIFEGVSNSNSGIDNVPKTLEQRDCSSLVDRSEGRASSVGFTGQRFRNMDMTPIQLEVQPISQVMQTSIKPIATGQGELTKFLLTPEERRHILKCEIEDKAGRELMKKAELQRRRLVQVLRDRYPQGALRVDGVNNLDSKVYGDRALARKQENERLRAHASARQERLRNLTMQEPRFGHDPFKHNEELLPPHETKFLQSKKTQPNSRADSHDRLFGSATFEPNMARAQALRNQDLLGKNVNILTNTKVDCLPCTIPDRSGSHDYSFMSHPSQASLERQRSLQGAVMPPGDRSTGMIIF